MTSYRVLDLFSGIGGFSLGLERAGMETVAFCEQDGYARRVLRKHWPDVWLYEDVKTLTAKRLRKDGLDPNVICGGFPCQDISTAGKGAGIEGARSGLWSEMLRLVKEVRPLWVVAENVPALRGRGADRVLADLEGAGYSARPVVVGAWAVGGNHRRERTWIVAHPCGSRHLGPFAQPPGERHESDLARCNPLADALCSGIDDARPWAAGPSDAGHRRQWLEAESRIRRVLDGVPARVDRLRCLGNAVVPLIPELIGRAITEYDARIEAA